MAAKLKPETVQHVAQLARLKLSESEIAVFSQQLSAVLESFEQISQVNTESVQPLVTPTETTLILRGDVVEAIQDTDTLLANAAEKSGRLFKVPPVV
jgi:aspartyl-tRNA(Asn)/glutamyl-tRNA(Gln) amidotransferase subunit C